MPGRRSNISRESSLGLNKPGEFRRAGWNQAGSILEGGCRGFPTGSAPRVEYQKTRPISATPRCGYCVPRFLGFGIKYKYKSRLVVIDARVTWANQAKGFRGRTWHTARDPGYTNVGGQLNKTRG